MKLDTENSHKKKLLENIPDRLYEKSESNSSEWIGSISRYFWYLGKRDFNSLYVSNDLKINKKVGRFVKFFLALLLIIAMYILYI